MINNLKKRRRNLRHFFFHRKQKLFQETCHLERLKVKNRIMCLN